MARSAPKPKLPTFDELMFSTQEERDNLKREKVMDIPLADIEPFPDHPFRVRKGEELDKLVESVNEFGVITPAVVRINEEGNYELVSGHRRHLASVLAGKETLPCIVRELSRDEGIIAMVDANLQREDILPSEKARSYKMKMDAIKRQGQRTDLTSRPVGEKLYSVDEISNDAPDSARQIHRYVRLTELEPELLDLVDEGKMAMRPAVEISYLPKEEQATLYDAIECEACTPSHAQAIKLRRFSEEGRLNEDVVLSIMTEEKGNQKEQFKMPKERIERFFKPGTPPERIEETIVKALELYQKRERSKALER